MIDSTKVNATTDFLRKQRGMNGSAHAHANSSAVSAHGMSFAIAETVQRVHLWRRLAVVLAVVAGVAVLSLLLASVTIQSVGQTVDRPRAVPLTDPTTAAPGTIRGDFGRDWGLAVQQNLVHGSDSVESAERELALWFA